MIIMVGLVVLGLLTYALAARVTDYVFDNVRTVTHDDGTTAREPHPSGLTRPPKALKTRRPVFVPEPAPEPVSGSREAYARMASRMRSVPRE